VRHCYVLRVFTRGGEGGNHLGVIFDLTGLDDDQMQSIAADLGFSETVFVDASDDPPVCRIFTPSAELPFAGHPLVGAAWVLHHLSPFSPTHLMCPVGAIAIDSDAIATRITTPANQSATHLADGDLDGLGFEHVVSAYSVTMPLPYTVVEVGSADEVARYKPVEHQLAAHPHGEMLTLWARDETGIRVRFFAPGHGILEDPATGSAAVALAAAQRQLGEPEGSFMIHQGYEVGMPSAIMLEWQGNFTSVSGEVRHDETRELEI